MVGTSLEVYSAYRFVNHAALTNKKDVEDGIIGNGGDNSDDRGSGGSSWVNGGSSSGSSGGSDGAVDSKTHSNSDDNIINYHSSSENDKFQYPIAICNMGETRAERNKLPGIVFKSESNCALLLKTVVDLL